jgi:hypothetical protein
MINLPGLRAVLAGARIAQLFWMVIGMMRYGFRVAAVLALSLTFGCAEGRPVDPIDGGTGVVDMGFTQVDVGGDVGPPDRVGLCEECTTDVQCGEAGRCVEFGDRRLCAARCDGEFGACALGFQCVEIVGQSGLVCVATDCCVDRDGDNYGLGIDCIAEDCNDDPDMNGFNVNAGIAEVCDGIDNNCVNGIDELPNDCEPAGCTLAADNVSYEEFNAASCVSGACAAGDATSCASFACSLGGAEGDVCATNCLRIVTGMQPIQDDALCALPFHCESNGTCQPDVPNGGTCVEDTDCSSAHCENGICCNAAAGECCATVADCLNGGPAVQTVCENLSTCQGTRGVVACDTTTFSCTTMEGLLNDSACTDASPSRECGLFADRFCNGMETQNETSTVCPLTCNTSADCDPGAFCNQLSQCELPRQDGDPCLDATYCESDFCSNGFCCGGRSGDDCCGTVDDCPASYSDVRTCAYPATCTGFREYATCVDSICDSNLNQSDASACSDADTFSLCGFFPTVFCSGTPMPRMCASMCEDESDCDANAHCDPVSSGSAPDTCVADVPNGQICNESSDCISGHCLNGFCCGNAGTGGVCCNNASACPERFTSPAECNNTMATPCAGEQFQAVCVDNECGTSATPTVVPAACVGEVGNNCGYFRDALCNASGNYFCATSCTDSSVCDAGANCTSGTCVPNAGQGGSCTNDAQCGGTLRCIDSVCCNVPSGSCNGTCEACNVPGLEGTCQPVPNGQDSLGECDALSCAGYYAGFNGDNCRVRTSLADNEVSCNGARACQTAAQLCPTAPAAAGPLQCDDNCQMPQAGSCTGTAPGVCTNISAGNLVCGVGQCRNTVLACNNGVDQTCTPYPSTGETCDQVDNDCDGLVDDNLNVGDINSACPTSPTHSDGNATFTQALYPSGDIDYFSLRESGSSDSCTDNEDARFKATLTVPNTATSSYELCVARSGGSICTGSYSNCVTIAPGGTAAIEIYNGSFNAGCWSGWSRYATVRVRSASNGWSCNNYTLSVETQEIE